jgi:hypothetical protein
MGYTFNGISKIISLTPGTTTMGVRDLYSRWKEWVVTGDNSKYERAFNSIGGDAIDVVNGIYIPAYIFLLNGWRIRPQEANHTLNVVDGILVVDGGGDPFLSTLGTYNVKINYSQPVQALTVATGGGGGAGISPELLTMLEEFLTIEGYKTGVVAENSPTLRKAGSVELAISGYGSNFTTVQKV